MKMIILIFSLLTLPAFANDHLYFTANLAALNAMSQGNKSKMFDIQTMICLVRSIAATRKSTNGLGILESLPAYDDQGQEIMCELEIMLDELPIPYTRYTGSEAMVVEIKKPGSKWKSIIIL